MRIQSAAALLALVIASGGIERAAFAQASEGPALTPFQKKVAAVMDMPHRSAANRKRDKNRDPVSALHFCRMELGMNVLDWVPGAGWYTEILGPLLKDNGRLYVSGLSSQLKRLDPLLSKPEMSAVVKLPVDDVVRHPVSHDITVRTLDFGRRDIDLVLSFREYHNLAEATVDKFNRAVHAALKPGGYYCVVDHTRRHMEPDTHENRRRIDPVKVIKQVLGAGFEFTAYTGLFWRPDDELRYEVGRRTVSGNTDRFALLFRKPAQ